MVKRSWTTRVALLGCLLIGGVARGAELEEWIAQLSSDDWRVRQQAMERLVGMGLREGRCWTAFGAMGADGQPQIQAQVWINLVDLGSDPQEAVAAPRIRVPPGGEGLWVEADYPETGEMLRAIPGAVPMPPRSWQMGHAQMLVMEGPGAWRAGTDPRYAFPSARSWGRGEQMGSA